MASVNALPLLSSQAYLEGKAVRETREMVADLCRHFYSLGWVTGTGGSITIKVHDNSVPKPEQLIVMSPSGVQKERMVPEDMYVLSGSGTVLSAPSPKPYPHKPPKCTDCAPLFMKAYEMRNAGAVIHSHGMESCLATMIHPFLKEFRMLATGFEKVLHDLMLVDSGMFAGTMIRQLNSVLSRSGQDMMKITHMEMIKGIQGHGYRDELVVPIIENTPHESELTESLSEAILGQGVSELSLPGIFDIQAVELCEVEIVDKNYCSDIGICEIVAYPKATAVLVRNHGIYIWGDSWISAKTQAECYHYLFDAAIKLHQMGIDWTTPSHGPISNMKAIQGKDRNLSGALSAGLLNGNHVVEPSRHCIVLDIEGTTTPISFVTDVLFPYAHDNVRKHLISTYDSEETKDDIKLLRAQVEDDLKQGVLGSVPIPSDNAGKEEVINALVTNVEAMIKADRKITSLKQLQGHIWRTGFQNKELQGIVYEDVPEALKKWHADGLKIYIYSSGSREAQRLIFGNTAYGDLRKYLSGFFDTMIGNKREERSYFEISQSVGVDKPSQILFVTDVYQEAVAAKAAGLEVLISVRPGNAPLPENHGFGIIKSFAEI